MKALSLLLYLFLSPFLEPTVAILYLSAPYLKPCIQVDRERDTERARERDREREREKERERERHTHTQTHTQTE